MVIDLASQGMGEHLLGGIVDVIRPQHIFKVTNHRIVISSPISSKYTPIGLYPSPLSHCSGATTIFT